MYEASKRILEQKLNNEYLPIQGTKSFLDNALKLAVGDELFKKTIFAAIQSLSGTGALRLAGEFLKKYGVAFTFLYDRLGP